MRKFLFLCIVTLWGGTTVQAQTQKLISPTFWQAGVQAIHQEQQKETTVISFTTFRHFFINLEVVNLNAYQLLRTGTQYRLVAKDSKVNFGPYLAEVSKGKILLTTPRYKGTFAEAPTSLFTEDYRVVILLLGMAEIEDTTTKRQAYEDYITQSGTDCALSNTYYSVGVGLNTAAAISHLNYIIKRHKSLGTFDDCTAISTQAETHCFFIGCFATFAWCCTN
ncbi:hypothetical protein [Flavobacterium sp.]|uniref:hypothetical protein n=1 Tax=Flavobacterium sp. TaxID=239 RepID=UPI0026271EF8|nr:hypothetical protein [Flavobacterium sp.]